MARLKTYRGAALSQISFPLGGIGSGSIGIGGDGRLIDWEIFNKPAKGSRNGHSHFAVRAMRGAEVLDARVLNGKALPPYTGTFVGNGKDILRSFGFGIPSETMPGYPNFRKCTFTGEYPFAELRFSDPAFPGTVKMTAFNPFIPLNEDDSSIPGAFFEIEFTNTSTEELEFEAAFSVRNPQKESRNTTLERGGFRMIRLEPSGAVEDILRQGEITIAVSGGDRMFFRENYLQDDWQGNIAVFWREFAEGVELKPNPCPPGHFDYAVVSARRKLAPGKCGSARFLLTWNYPRTYNYWKPRERVIDGEKALAKPWKNYYAVLWKDSCESAAYALKNWDRLLRDSMCFRKAFHSAGVPRSVLDAASANLSILKSPTVLRLEDGSFWGWEGLHADHGSCYGTCQHVWSYAYALPFLFPRLQRSIHSLSYKHNVTPAGGLTFRVLLPLDAKMKHPFRPAADAQFAEIVCAYRDWKISGNAEWLKSIWKNLKRTLEYAWADGNFDRWDPGKTGVLTGRQHHTLDIEMFGPNAWLTGLYLAALEAGAEMADFFGESASAKEYRAIAEKGRNYIRENLFNGEWFIQKIDLRDKSVLESVPDDPDDPWYPGGINKKYWLPEYGELKAQIGEGCGIDQCLAQWHANLCGLPPVFEAEQVKSAMRSIYKYNFIRRMGDFVNTGRIFALNEESGVVICTWPKKNTQPMIPVYYNSECMYGFEYSAAALMIQSGLVREGLEIVERGRSRFDGIKRNPWNEFECGSNYARSMASYSLLNSLSGFQFDMTQKMIGFSPVDDKGFKAFWSVDGAWGTVECPRNTPLLKVLYGELELNEFRFHDRVFRFHETKRIKAGKSFRFCE